MIKLPLISLIHLTLQANFGITLGMMKSNGCVALLHVYYFIYLI